MVTIAQDSIFSLGDANLHVASLHDTQTLGSLSKTLIMFILNSVQADPFRTLES